MQMTSRARCRSRRVAVAAGASLLAVAAWGCGPSQDSISDDTSASADEGGQAVKGGAAAEYAPDSILVRFRSARGAAALSGRTTSLARVQGSIADANRDGIDDRFANLAGGELAAIQLAKGADVVAALELLKDDPNVLYAEPNYIVHAIATPNDPQFPQLYGLDNTGQTGGTADADVDGPEAWDLTVGSSDIVVGVVNTGIDYTHEDLAGNVFVNPNEIAGNGVDDDGNGVIDDVHGFNAITGSGDPADDNAHGSHCSGTIGAVGNNGVGVAGVNWDVTIMGLKFLGAGGSGTLEDAIEAINYAVGMKNAGVNLRVLSNSWSGGGFSQALLDAINAANAVDILFVAAAGNSGSDNDVTPTFPANYDAPNVVSVAATDHADARAGFSCFGATTVDLGAPGVNVLSTTPGNTYSVFSGTSMATPHVAGAAALVLSVNETLTTGELKDLLMTTVDPVASLEGITVTGGRLNAATAVGAAGPPVPRFNLGASPASQTVSQGEATSYTVDVASIAGFAGDVALTVASDPALDAVVDVTPVVTAPGTGTLSVTTSEATAAGTYNLTVTGTSGDLVRTTTVSLRVRLAGTVDTPFPSADTPIAIPDVSTITSTINVPQSITLQEVAVDIDITHTFIGDLLVTLTSPAGTVVTLHNRAGGGTDDIHQTFTVPSELTGQDAAGNWVLTVADQASIDVGSLDAWTLHAIGVPN